MATGYTSPASRYSSGIGQIAAGPDGDSACQIPVATGDDGIEMGMLCSMSGGKAVRGLNAATSFPLWCVTTTSEMVVDIWGDGSMGATGYAGGMGVNANFVTGNAGVELFTNQYSGSGATLVSGTTLLTNSTTVVGEILPIDTADFNSGIQAIVGSVTRGLMNDNQQIGGRDVLYFCPYYIPPTTLA
jgi:hypothetical protein